jgi:hypothetical protein
MLAGVFGTGGYFLITWAYRLLDISALQPLAFLGIVWATLFRVRMFRQNAAQTVRIAAGKESQCPIQAISPPALCSTW